MSFGLLKNFWKKMKNPVGELRLQNLLSYAKIIQFIYRLAAIELNRKSQMISEAVEEVLNLVQDATQKFKSMMSMDSEDLGPSKPCHLNSIYNLFSENVKSFSCSNGIQFRTH